MFNILIDTYILPDKESIKVLLANTKSTILQKKSDKNIVSFVIGYSNNNAFVFYGIAHENQPGVKLSFHKKLDESTIAQSMLRITRYIDNILMEAFCEC